MEGGQTVPSLHNRVEVGQASGIDRGLMGGEDDLVRATTGVPGKRRGAMTMMPTIVLSLTLSLI